MKFLFKILFSLSILFFFTDSASAHYGPRGLLGGTISCGIHQDGFAYLGTKEGGVYVTTTTAATAWRLRAVGLKSGKITALTHSGVNLFAATADKGVYIFNGKVGNDLYWNEINTGLSNHSISSLVAIDSNIVLAGSNGSGLFKTTDRGVQWTAINSPLLNNSNITGLTKAGTRIIAITNNGGVFKSDDNGDTWSDFNDINTLGVANTRAISYNATTDELLVLNQYGLYKLTTASTHNNPSYTLENTGLPLGTDIRYIASNATNWYLATGNGVYTSGIASISWTLENNGLLSTDVNAVVAMDATVFAGMNKRGVCKSAVSTISWVDNNSGMSNVGVRSLSCLGDTIVVVATEYGVLISKNIAVNFTAINNGLLDSLNVNDVQFADNILFAATQNSGIFMSSDFGLTWTPINNGLPNLNIKKIFYANGQKYVLDSQGKLYESALMVNNWVLTNAGLAANSVVTCFAAYANKLVIGTYGDGVYVKDRSAATWTAFNMGLSNLNVTALTASSAKLYAGTDGSGVFVSDYNNASWTGASPIFIDHFNHVPLDASHIQDMASFAGYVIASYKGGIAASFDEGVTWEAAGNQFNLPSYSDYNKIAFVTTRIFVTTGQNSNQSNSLAEFDLIDTVLTVSETTITAPSGGLTSYHNVTSNINWQVSSSDTWATVNTASGFRNGVLEIVLQPNAGATRTATVTLTGGPFTRVININQDGATAINVIEASAAINIYPNPSQGEFVIDLNELNDVEQIQIFDAMGRVVQTVKTTGENKITINQLNISGTYIVAIKTAKQLLTKRIVVQ